MWIRGASYVLQIGIFVYLYRSFAFLSKVRMQQIHQDFSSKQ